MDTTPITEVTTDKASEPVADDVENGDATIKSNGAEENNDEIDDEDEEDDIKAVEGEDEDTPMADETAGDMETENTEDASEDVDPGNSDAGETKGMDNSKPKKEHPFQHLIDSYEVPQSCLERVKKVQHKFPNTRSTFVSTKPMLEEVAEQLMLVKEIGLVAKVNTRSYAPRVCILAISTRRGTYIIDTLKLQNHMHILGDVFLSPKILKIATDSQKMLKQLQLDHTLYFLNLFDTAIAMKKLGWDHMISRQYFEKYGVVFGVPNVLTNWHMRPLPDNYQTDLINSATCLIPTYLYLKNKLINKKVMEDVLKMGNQRCGAVYRRSDSLADFFPNMAYMTPGQIYVMHELEEWRHRVGKKKKRNISLILPVTNLKKLVHEMPTEKMEILKLADTQTVALHLDEVHKIMLTGKEFIGPVMSRFAESAKQTNEQTASKTGEKGAEKEHKGKPKTNKNKKGGVKNRKMTLHQKAKADYLKYLQKVASDKTAATGKPRRNRTSQFWTFREFKQNKPMQTSRGNYSNRSDVWFRNDRSRPPVWEQASGNGGGVWQTPMQLSGGWNNSNNFNPMNFGNQSDFFTSDDINFNPNFGGNRGGFASYSAPYNRRSYY